MNTTANHTKKTLATALEVLRLQGHARLIGPVAQYQKSLSFRQGMAYPKADLVNLIDRKVARYGADSIDALLTTIASN